MDARVTAAVESLPDDADNLTTPRTAITAHLTVILERGTIVSGRGQRAPF